MFIFIVLSLVGHNSAVSLVRMGYTYKSGSLPFPEVTLLQCARELGRGDTESATVSSSGECLPLLREWLVNKTMATDLTYMTSLVKDIKFKSPASLHFLIFLVFRKSKFWVLCLGNRFWFCMLWRKLNTVWGSDAKQFNQDVW